MMYIGWMQGTTILDEVVELFDDAGRESDGRDICRLATYPDRAAPLMNLDVQGSCNHLEMAPKLTHELAQVIIVIEGEGTLCGRLPDGGSKCRSSAN